MNIFFFGLGSWLIEIAFVALNCFSFHEFSFIPFVIFHWTGESERQGSLD